METVVFCKESGRITVLWGHMRKKKKPTANTAKKGKAGL